MPAKADTTLIALGRRPRGLRLCSVNAWYMCRITESRHVWISGVSGRCPGNNAGWSIPYLLSGLADWQLLPVKSINITSNMVEL